MPDEEKEKPEGLDGTPEVASNPDRRREWSAEDLDRLREALTADDEAEAAARADQVEAPEDLPPEVEEAVDELEEEYQESVDAKRHEILRLRAGMLTGILGRLQKGMDVAFQVPGTKRVAEFVDLHTVENVMEFAMELFPFVGGTYAITGYRLDVREHPETKDRILELEEIGVLDRFLYGLGELMVSGHILRGIAKSIMKRTLKHTAKQFIAHTGKRAAENLTRRAKKGAERILTGKKK